MNNSKTTTMKNLFKTTLKAVCTTIVVLSLTVPSFAQTLVQKIVSYDEYGNPLEVEDNLGVRTSYIWDDSGLELKGIAKNASDTDVKIFNMSDFETNIYGDLVTGAYLYHNGDGTVTYSEGYEQGISHQKVEIENLTDKGAGFMVSVGSQPVGKQFLVEFEYKVEDGALQLTGLNSSTGLWVNWFFSEVTSGWKKASVLLTISTNGNLYFRAPFNGGGDYTDNIFYFRHIRIYPKEAQVLSANYEAVHQQPSVIYDGSLSTNYFKYDTFARLKETYNTNGTRVSKNEYYYSLDGNSNYDPTDPNRVENWTYYDVGDTSKVIKSVNYLDGLGRAIQSQVRGADSTILTDTKYNSRGLPEVSSRPFIIPNQTSYFPNAFEGSGSFTPGAALPVSSKIENEYDGAVFDGDEVYAYSQTKYESSPLARVEKSTLPGASHKMGSGREMRTYYSLNSDTLETFVINSKSWYKRTLNKTITEDPNKNRTITYTDGWGQTIVSGVDMDGDTLLSQSSTEDLLTLFSYDLKGNLVRVEDPRGLVATYTYNTLGQLIGKDLPDQADSVNYRYDKKGRLRFTETAEHKKAGGAITVSLAQSGNSFLDKTITPTKTGKLSFTVSVAVQYDDYNAWIFDNTNNEELISDIAYLDLGEEITANKAMISRGGSYKFKGEPEEYGDDGTKTTSGSLTFNPFKFSYTIYDSLDRIQETGEYFGSTSFTDSVSLNTRTFPSSDKQPMVVYKYDQENAYSGATNLKGRVAQVWYYDPNDLDVAGKTYYSYNELGLVKWVKQQIPGLSIKTIEYEYDELGRITRLFFNPSGTGDDHYFWYYYDEFGRLDLVTSSGSNSPGTALKEAEYLYYADGQVKQLILGDGAQTIDYTYTVQGWMDKINDGETNGTDRFGMSLSYNLNGNIRKQEWEQSELVSPGIYYYKYDKANRLLEANFSDSTNDYSMYDVEYEYDRNGNIKNLSRRDDTGVISSLGVKFNFINIEAGSNRISSITENLSMDNKDVKYDEMGNMIQNDIQGLKNTTYDWRNLPTWMVANDKALLMAYDADGQRVKKKQVDGSTLYYIRGVDGQTVAAYNQSGEVLFLNIVAGGQVIGQIINE